MWAVSCKSRVHVSNEDDEWRHELAGTYLEIRHFDLQSEPVAEFYLSAQLANFFLSDVFPSALNSLLFVKEIKLLACRREDFLNSIIPLFVSKNSLLLEKSWPSPPQTHATLFMCPTLRFRVGFKTNRKIVFLISEWIKKLGEKKLGHCCCYPLTQPSTFLFLRDRHTSSQFIRNINNKRVSRFLFVRVWSESKNFVRIFFRFAFQVSWIRKRDLHILTAGILTYTSDQRFQVNRPDKSENWTLQIKFPQLRDSGIYECQVNTEPKMSLAFRLNVIGKFSN